MMARDMPRGLFLALVAAVAVGLAMAVSQVAQPLRSVVVLWLLVGAPLLAFVLRVLKHAAHMRATAPPVAKAPAPLPAVRWWTSRGIWRLPANQIRSSILDSWRSATAPCHSLASRAAQSC